MHKMIVKYGKYHKKAFNISNFDSEKNPVQKSIKIMQIMPQFYFNFKTFLLAVAYIIIQGSYETWKSGKSGKLGHFS